MTVLDQAQNVSGVVSAARLRERWQQQEAKATDPERREQLREAIADVEARFPELEDVPPGGAEAFARERGHGSKSRSPVHEGRRRPAATKAARSAPAKPAPAPAKPKPASRSKAPASTPSPSRRAPRRRRRSVVAVGGYRSSRLIRETGIPGATWSATSVTMSLLGATVGLSLLYLVLTSAERSGSGANAVPHLLAAVTGFMQRFVSTRDILGEGGGGVIPTSAPPSYTERVIAGEVAGPPNLLGMLPELPPIKQHGVTTPAFKPGQNTLPPHLRPRRRRRR